MANNRLWLVDVRTKERCLLAKGWSSGWDMWEPEAIEAWLKKRMDPAITTTSCKSVLTIEDDDGRILDGKDLGKELALISD